MPTHKEKLNQFTLDIEFLLIAYMPVTFLQNHWHISLVTIQAGFALIFLLNAIRSFRKRAALITTAEKE